MNIIEDHFNAVAPLALLILFFGDRIGALAYIIISILIIFGK